MESIMRKKIEKKKWKKIFLEKPEGYIYIYIFNNVFVQF